MNVMYYFPFLVFPNLICHLKDPRIISVPWCTVSCDSKETEYKSSKQKGAPVANENEDYENFFEDKRLIQSQTMYVVLLNFSAQ